MTETTKNFIQAASNYAEANCWTDEDFVSMISHCGITKEDFIELGKGNYAEEYSEYFED